MEDKYKELLETHRSKFSLVVDVDRLLPILENAETLTSSDVDEINKQTTKQAKVDKVLDILIAKDNQAFKALCYALEPTYPHLLTVMFLGNGQRMNPETRSVSLTSDSEEDVLRSSQSSSGDARSQDLKATYTRIIPSYEYELHDGVPQESNHVNPHTHHTSTKHKPHNTRYKHGMNGETRHNDHNRDYDWLKSQCERAMTELQALKMQQTDNTKRYEAVMKESDSYRQSYMQTLGQLQQSREEINLVRSQNNDLIADNKRMEQEVSNLRKFRDEDKQEIAELRQHQREVVSKSGSTEVLTALDMYDRIKQEYDNLREQFTDTASQRRTLVLKCESLQEECSQLKKQYQAVCSERDSVVVERNGLKQQCTAAIRNWDQVTQQRDDIMKEMNQALASQLRAKKELEVVQTERDAALREYSLVMSERDQVHKEIEQLQEKLTVSTKRIDVLLKEKKTALDEAETLKREITCALQDRDKAVKERNEFSDKYNDMLGEQSAIKKERDVYKKDYEMSIHERDIARKERQEALQDRDRILREKYEREQREKADKMDQVSKETEHLRKNMEKLQQDLQDGMHEAEIAKNRRDWAMSERDKIVQERDSMRTLCDNLRRDRDRAVTDLAHALRDYDEMKKQKQDAVKELTELKEKYDNVNDKGPRKGQLNTVAHNHSRDSAIDADLQEWESETIDVELAGYCKEDYGFDIVGGKNEPYYPNDNSLFVSHVIKGGAADGKLQINDQLVRIENTEVSNVDKRYAMKLLQSRSGVISMVVKRRKVSPSRSWQALQISIPPGKDLGIHFDNGLFVSHINPGSYAAKEGLLCAGDRIVSVNNRSVENMTPDDLLKVLYQCGGDTLVLDIWRQMSPLNSTGSSPIPLGSPGIHSDPLLSSSTNSKNDSKRWDTASESSKGSMKNIKTSGSQTDSLDSPGLPRRPKDRKNKDNRDLEHKGRHSVHIIDRALETVKMIRQRHKSAERSEEEKAGLSISARPMVDNHEDVVGEFAFPQHQPDMSSASQSRLGGHSKGADPIDPSEIGGTGTWPKCVKLTNAPLNGTYVHPPQKNTPKRPTLDGLINYQTENIPTARVPPLPPERSKSSFSAVRHTPTNSDSTITSYSSRPESPISSPCSINTSPYYPKSPLPRAHISEPLEHFGYSHPNNSSSTNSRPKVNTTKNPPRMPPIHSQVSPGQFQLDPRPGFSGTVQRRPAQRQINKDQRPMHISPPSQLPIQPGDYMSRSYNTTPEPNPGPRRFTDVPPESRHCPIPNTVSQSPPFNNPMLTPSSVAKARKQVVYVATTSVHVPPFTRTFPGSNSDIDQPPQYSDCAISPSSSIERGFADHLTGSSHNRIRIPSTPSVPDTSGSVEVVSDRSSPCSPFLDFKLVPSPLPPFMDTLPRMKKPQPGETRKINIVKTSNPVGFTIEMGPSGGIFVSSVNENSLAAQAGLVIGDQLLEICAINMRNATYDLAARVLQQCGNSLMMLVQYNPEKYNDNSGSSAASSTNISPINSPDSTPGKRLVKGSNQPNSPKRVHSHSSSGKYDSIRKISFKKPNPNASLGIRLTGGNTTGIFVQNVEENSPAGGINGILCGDQILEYNGINFSHATAENAYFHLQQPCSTVRIKVRYHLSLYNKVRNKKAADSLYVRAMLDHIAEKEGELSFRKDDLLHIVDTMYQGQQGVWYAYLVNDVGEKIKEGTIPSKGRLEDDLLHRSVSDNSSLHESDDFKSHSRRGSGSARRSFFRRSKKHQRNNSKDSRDFNSFSDVSLNSDSLAGLDDLSHSAYLPVDRLEYKKTRPVVLIAPLAEPLIQKLAAESPDKYYYCKPSVMQKSLAMEKGLKDEAIVDYWPQDDNYLCIHVNSITEICDKDIHCLLNVNPLAIERLHRLQIYPIVIYARHKSYKQLREVKDVQFLSEKLSMKVAKEQYEYCQKAEQDYRHLISATIQGGNLAEMTQQIKNVIATEQEKPIWVPSSSMMR